MSSQFYRVLYTTDSSKKRKVYHDGFLQIGSTISDSFVLVELFSSEGSCLKKSNEKTKLVAALTGGDEISVGAYLIQVEELLTDACISSIPKALITKFPLEANNEFNAQCNHILPKTSSNKKYIPPTIQHEDSNRSESMKRHKLDCSDITPPNDENADIIATHQANQNLNSAKERKYSALSVSATSSITAGDAVVLDPSLAKKMREHQLHGANFILSIFNRENRESEDYSEYMGAILADEVNPYPTYIASRFV